VLNFLINLSWSSRDLAVFSSVAVIIKDIYIFFSVVNNCKCIRVFKLFIYLNIKAYIAILPKGLYIYNLLLLKVLFYFITTAFYKIFIKFLFRLLQNLKIKR